MSSTKNVVYRAFLPMALFGRFVGFFPLSGLRSATDDIEKLDPRSFIFRYLLSSVAFTLVTVECGLNLFLTARWNRDEPIVDTLAMLMFAIVGRLTSILLTFVSFIKAPSWRSYFVQWHRVDNIVTNKSSLKTYGWTFTVVGITATAMYNMTAFYSNYMFFKDGHSGQWTIYLRAVVIMADYYARFYFPLGFVLFLRSLDYGYRRVFRRLELRLCRRRPPRLTASLECCCRCPSASGMSRELRDIRLEHQSLSCLAAATEALMSPFILIILSSQTIILCSNVYRIVEILLHDKTLNLHGLNLLLYTLLEFFVLAILCITAAHLRKTYSDGLKVIYRAKLNGLNDESRFQIELLHSKVVSKPLLMSASGFVVIDSTLFTRIVGVVVTYVVVLIQFGNVNETDNAETTP